MFRLFRRRPYKFTPISNDDDFLGVLEMYYRWYRLHSRWWGFLRTTCEIVLYGSSLTTVALAAAGTNNNPKWPILTTTVLTAASASLLSQFQVKHMKELREEGRILCEHFLILSRFQVTNLAGHREDLAKFNEDIITNLNNLDIRQFGRFAAIMQGRSLEMRSDNVANQSKADKA
jgi:hypothetical protein